LCLLSVYLTAAASYGIYTRWNQGGFPLGASIFAAIVFGLCALFYGRRLARLF
jgi:hypothetical protein